ncbi:MAG TPA: helix-turn-helix domain-containing protein, partial [Thermoanaerobaculia bacterium]|nr:helix-turn-helix domain-containing protein [Thermoanaerobaculia bacterium]
MSQIDRCDAQIVFAFARDAVKALLDYPFPGNVRELENLLEGAAALVSGDTIEAADLQFGIAREVEGDLRVTSTDLRNVENAHILRVLAQVKGNKSRAAKLLGVSRRTLYRKR